MATCATLTILAEDDRLAWNTRLVCKCAIGFREWTMLMSGGIQIPARNAGWSDRVQMDPEGEKARASCASFALDRRSSTADCCIVCRIQLSCTETVKRPFNASHARYPCESSILETGGRPCHLGLLRGCHHPLSHVVFTAHLPPSTTMYSEAVDWTPVPSSPSRSRIHYYETICGPPAIPIHTLAN